MLASSMMPARFLAALAILLLTGVQCTSDAPDALSVERARQMDAEMLTDRLLTLAGSTQVKLKSVADYSVETVPSRIVRENQQYKRYVEVDYRGPHRMGEAFLKDALEEFSTPPGYSLERDDSSFFTEDAGRAFGWVLLGTIVLVFLATAAASSPRPCWRRWQRWRSLQSSTSRAGRGLLNRPLLFQGGESRTDSSPRRCCAAVVTASCTAGWSGASPS